ncbi:MAG: hypothetical protein F4X59_17620 [Holophagales bacterium]|nr:hypothetical protein [Holophagales bacterium]MYC11925.1 hypothetical protein [Holophagales bacterium]
MPDPVDLSYAVDLPPQRAIEYFRSKGYALTWSWRDMSEEAHALAFTVAKSAGFNILGDIRGAVDEALAEGQTYQQFAKNLEPLLKRRGWWGRQVNPETGESVLLGSPRRLKTIYRTNIRTSMAASRFQAMKDNVDERPYWMYDAINDSVTRPSHAALDGLVFRHDDPFWETHFPPNGFNCRCRVRAFTRRELEQRGLDVTSSKGRMMRVDQDFGVRQTSTMGYQAPGTDGEILIPDPGFGRRPLPGLAVNDSLIQSMRRAFDTPVDEAIAAGRNHTAALQRIGPADDEIDRIVARTITTSDPRQRNVERHRLRSALLRERGKARRTALLELIRERREVGVEIRTLRAANEEAAPIVDRMKELSKMLPADWVRRANFGPGVTVRGGRFRGTEKGHYNPMDKEIVIRRQADATTILHELVHHLQEMNPEVDSLFDAWFRRGQRPLHYRDYANTLVDGAGLWMFPYGNFGSVLSQVDRRFRSRPVELMTTALEALATPHRFWLDAGAASGWAYDSDTLDAMIDLDRDYLEFLIGVLVGW